jgi:hypothetical protein
MLCGDLIMTFVDESVMDVLRTRIMELEAEVSVLKDITIKKQAYIIELEKCISERIRDVEASCQLAMEYPEVFNNV